MMICKRLTDNFDSGREPESAQMISNDLDLPFGITAKVLEILKEVHLLTEVELKGNQLNGYLPLRNLDELKTSELLSLINNNGVQLQEDLFQGAFHVYFDLYSKLTTQMQALDGDFYIKDLPWPKVE